ncbi:MAG: hypothetical protein JJT89_06685 [Nitriliruptoraceae bacterium]|nr:hypothetical protein [Nitriliruptoraceae bacterium]
MLLDASGQVRPAAFATAGLVTVAPDQAHLRSLRAEVTAQADSPVVVPGAGLQPALGLLLAALAADATGDPVDVAVTYALPDDAWPVSGAGPARRRVAARELTDPPEVLEDGTLLVEPLAEHRRLAWFPRPVGPRHAVAIPGTEPQLLADALPSLRTARTYLALPGWRAEWLQFAGNLARWEPTRRRLVARLERPSDRDGEEHARQRRWACVVEARGAAGVARAWAYGRDPEQCTAQLAATLVGRLSDHLLGVPSRPVPADADPARAGAVTSARATHDRPRERLPSQLDRPGAILDEVAAHTGMRWSIARPDPAADPDTG